MSCAKEQLGLWQLDVSRAGGAEGELRAQSLCRGSAVRQWYRELLWVRASLGEAEACERIPHPEEGGTDGAGGGVRRAGCGAG